MKHLLTLLAVLCLSFTSTEALALKIDIDEYITAENGCRFHVTGWVNVNVGFNGITMNHYDVTMDGPCGRFHFEGLVDSDESGARIYEAKLYDLDKEAYEDVSSSHFLGSTVTKLEALYDEH
ncbi:MAG: hypothetical protein JNL43_05805 [Flavobacteriales bacterium]|nr:hypothetical protein [Flavobacteriales bacterium]